MMFSALDIFLEISRLEQDGIITEQTIDAVVDSLRPDMDAIGIPTETQRRTAVIYSAIDSLCKKGQTHEEN